CDIGEEELATLSEVPSRSLLSRITDHYMQILANQAPIGFEAEFVNQRGATIAYRGILLPFSSDDDTIDLIYGVINGKELADARVSDELLLEIDQALEPKAAALDIGAPLTEWADGPGAEPANDLADATAEVDSDASYDAADEFMDFDLPEALADDEDDGDDDAIPIPSFGLNDDEDDEPARGPAFGSLLRMPIQTSKATVELPEDPTETFNDGFEATDPFGQPAFSDSFEEPAPAALDEASTRHAIDMPEIDPADMALGDWLAAAREMAAAARGNEDRTREALYEAIGRAYDFSLAAAETPNEFSELLADSGLSMQERAPMTPVVKLVFGADYDKTRLTEYAAALSHAHRLELPRGSLGEFLGTAEGGLKGVVKAERRLRREEAGKAVEPVDAPRRAIAKKLRALPAQPLEAIAAEGSEFALVMIRRTETGDVVSLGEIPGDIALVERAARRLIG